MKPKFQNYLRKAFPSLIVIPTMAAMLPALSQAGIISDDTFGNVTANDGSSNGANTIRADGGSSANPTVAISSGVNLTGSIAPLETEVLEITSAGYTVTLAAGALLNGSNHNGIFSTFAFTLNNAGTIDGNGAARSGVFGVGGTLITNSGTISGDLDAIFLSTNGGTITNTGTINGVVDAFSSGIEAQSNVSVFNNGSGTISGVYSGVYVNDGLNLTNQTSAVITGSNFHGVRALNSATISNFGLIQSGATLGKDGVSVGNSANVSNLTTFNIFGVDTAGGRIIGRLSGVDAGDGLLLTNQFRGLIQGTTQSGVKAGANARITNNAVITGGQDGIAVSSGAVITNNFGATISGNDDGINVGTGATITNNFGATITGGQDGIDIDDTGSASVITNAGTINGGSQSAIDGSDSVETVNNSGLIQGGTIDAINLKGGADILNLNLGSRIIGNVFGGNDAAVDTLNFNGGLTDTSSASGSNSNSILGNVGQFEIINKTGGGVAFIGVPGNGGYTVGANTINITGGGLYINGNISAYSTAQTIINAGGAALGGTGLWDADLFITAGGMSAGAIPINLDVNPANAVGNLSILGNVTHSSGSFLRHDIVPNGTDDLIIHSGGTYALGANTDVRVSTTNNNTVIRDGIYTVIDSNALITGALPDMAVQFNNNVNSNDFGFVGTRTFNTGAADTSAVLNLFMQSALADGGTNLVFSVQHNYQGLGALLGFNEASLGAALDNSVTNPNLQIQDFVAALDYSDIFAVNQTLSSLVPSGIFGLTSGVANSNYRLHRMAQNHLATTRSDTVIEMTPDSVDAKGHTVPGTSSSRVSGNGNVWGSFSYDWQDSDNVDGEVSAFTVGADYRVAPNFLVGLMLDGSQADNDFTGGSADVDSLRAAIYATYGASTGIYADFLVGYGDHNLDLDRNFVGGIINGTSSSSTDATSLQAMAIVGYAMEAGSVKHGPFAGLEYQNIDVDSFTQTGPLPLGVSSFDVDSFRALIGYRVEASYGQFTPYASIAYAHEFEDGFQSSTATLPGGTTFQVRGGELDSAILLGLGTGYNITSNLGVNIGYRGEITIGDGLDSHGGTIGLNYSF